MLDRQLLFDQSKERFDFLRGQYLWQGPSRCGAWQCGGRIVGTQPLFLQKAVECAQGGDLSRDGRGRQLCPGCRQPCNAILRRDRKAAQNRRRAFQIGAIGQQGVARCAPFSRHHFQKPTDQRAIFSHGLKSA